MPGWISHFTGAAVNSISSTARAGAAAGACSWARAARDSCAYGASTAATLASAATTQARMRTDGAGMVLVVMVPPGQSSRAELFDDDLGSHPVQDVLAADQAVRAGLVEGEAERLTTEQPAAIEQAIGRCQGVDVVAVVGPGDGRTNGDGQGIGLEAVVD